MKNHICKKCGGIAGWDSYFQSWICTRCGNQEPKSITNADRIRTMTDEELAKHYTKFVGCPISVIDYRGCDASSECKASACWLNWLKEETSDA